MSVRLDGRVAVVTGAGGGLGRSHALLLAKLGAAVVVNDPGVDMHGGEAEQGLAQRVVDEIVSAGGRAVANRDSVADCVGAARLIQTAVDEFGGIDILVNNAGILRDRTFAKMDLADFDSVLAVHLTGTVNCTHAAWPIMNERKYGRIVLTSSPSGIGGSFGQSNYGAAKTAVLGFMNCLALEGARNGVLVNAISPGAITRMTESQVPAELARLMSPELVSPAVAWLASDRCTESGIIVNALGGYFSRIHYFETEGVQFNPTEPVSADMVDEAFQTFGQLSQSVHPVQPGPLGNFVARMKAMGLLKDDFDEGH